MKIEKVNNKYIIYIIKEYLEYSNINFENNAAYELKKLFSKINKKYNLNLEGFYEVIVHMNNDYGIIIEMEKDDDNYVKLFNNKLDMKITFKFDEKIYYSCDDGCYLFDNYLYSENPNYEGNMMFGGDISKLINIKKSIV